jgi:uncharacterized membrane protein YfcA
MSLLQALGILIAGVAAGTINTVVGSGTLITFPVLLSLGYAPVVANVSNTIGLVPGSVAGAYGYRNELTGERRRLFTLAGLSALGGVAGAILLLVLPPGAFKAIVPVFILAALVLIVLQPRLNTRMASRGHQPARHGGRWAQLAILVCGVYGGYFGAAQGILMLAILGLALNERLQRINALKVVIVGSTNLVAGLLFGAFAHVAWLPALLIAVGSLIGGIVGARVGSHLNPRALRGVVLLVGLAAIVRLLV